MPHLSPEGEFNMNEDRALLSEAERGVSGWRLYTWREPCVTLGRSQLPERDLLAGAAIGYAPRPTGGRAVLHGHDLTVGLAFPLRALGLLDGERSVRAVYRAAIQPLVVALQAVGVPAVFGDERPAILASQRSADCFSLLSGNDVVNADTGHKLGGCALRLTECAVLVQASLPVRQPLVDPATIFRVPAAVHPTEMSEETVRQALNQACERAVQEYA